MKGADRWLFVAVLWGALVSALVVAGVRSGLPDRMDGTVVTVGWVAETGYALRTVEFDDGTVLTLDRRVADRMEPGDVVSKDAWSRRVSVGEQTVWLRPSGEVWRFALAGAVTVLVCRLGSAGRTEEPPVGDEGLAGPG